MFSNPSIQIVDDTQVPRLKEEADSLRLQLASVSDMYQLQLRQLITQHAQMANEAQQHQKQNQQLMAQQQTQQVQHAQEMQQVVDERNRLRDESSKDKQTLAQQAKAIDKLKRSLEKSKKAEKSLRARLKFSTEEHSKEKQQLLTRASELKANSDDELATLKRELHTVQTARHSLEKELLEVREKLKTLTDDFNAAKEKNQQKSAKDSSKKGTQQKLEAALKKAQAALKQKAEELTAAQGDLKTTHAALFQSEAESQALRTAAKQISFVTCSSNKEITISKLPEDAMNPVTHGNHNLMLIHSEEKDECTFISANALREARQRNPHLWVIETFKLPGQGRREFRITPDECLFILNTPNKKYFCVADRALFKNATGEITLLSAQSPRFLVSNGNYQRRLEDLESVSSAWTPECKFLGNYSCVVDCAFEKQVVSINRIWHISLQGDLTPIFQKSPQHGSTCNFFPNTNGFRLPPSLTLASSLRPGATLTGQ